MKKAEVQRKIRFFLPLIDFISQFHLFISLTSLMVTGSSNPEGMTSQVSNRVG